MPASASGRWWSANGRPRLACDSHGCKRRVMKSALMLGAAALLASTFVSAAPPRRAKEPARPAAAKADTPRKEYFRAGEVRSTGSVTVGGQAIAFDAIAGTIVVHAKDWSDTDALDADTTDKDKSQPKP